MCVAFPHSEYYGPLTSHDPFARPRFIGLLAHTAILAGITGYPTFTHESSKHAMFTDPGSAQTSRPRLEKKNCLSWMSGCCLRCGKSTRPLRKLSFRGSITSTFRPTACFSYYLRLTHVVTSTGPRLYAGYAGLRLPGGTCTL